ncbi:MAG: PHB depolymerase family esterase [Armatimonadota bacterium]
MQSRTISVSSLNRHYIVYIPDSYYTQKFVSLVIMLHGGGGTARGAMEETGWIEKAKKEGFIAAFPEAVRRDESQPPRFLRNPQFWNDGSGRAHSGRENIDDVGFIDAMIDDLMSSYVIDKRKIFISGFSNGASMTYRAGVELSKRIAAIAPVSGHLWTKPEKLEREVSVLAITGVEDPLNPFNGGETVNPWGDNEIKPQMADSVKTWAGLLGCSDGHEVINDGDGVKTISCGKCRNGAEALFCAIDGLGHVWPGGKSLLHERIVGKGSDRLNATDAIWQFFIEHTIP